MARKTKKQELREAFLRYEVLTPLTALNKYRCMSLSQRVGEFNRQGMHIKSEKVEGQPYHRYYIEQPKQLELAA